VFEFDLTQSSCEFAQCTWNVKGQRTHLFFLDLDLLAVSGLDRVEGCVCRGFGPAEASSMIAARTQTIDGKPSTIFSHDLHFITRSKELSAAGPLPAQVQYPLPMVLR